ncbi:hypothetical protein PO909_007405 [Leuciscus waleckii]
MRILTAPITSIFPNHLQDGPFPPSSPPPPGWSLPLPPGGWLRPCLHLQAGFADSVTLALLAKDGAYAKDYAC